jgi:hypothetical protein
MTLPGVGEVALPDVSEFPSCVLCGRTPVVGVGVAIPLSEGDTAAFLRLRTTPLLDGDAPVIGYGLCRTHMRHVSLSAAQVQALFLAVASQVVVQ